MLTCHYRLTIFFFLLLKVFAKACFESVERKKKQPLLLAQTEKLQFWRVDHIVFKNDQPTGRNHSLASLWKYCCGFFASMKHSSFLIY